MKIKRLMAATEAAGFAMAVPEEYLDEAPAPAPVVGREAEQDQDDRWHDAASANWLRDWMPSFMSGRAPA